MWSNIWRIQELHDKIRFDTKYTAASVMYFQTGSVVLLQTSCFRLSTDHLIKQQDFDSSSDE